MKGAVGFEGEASNEEVLQKRQLSAHVQSSSQHGTAVECNSGPLQSSEQHIANRTNIVALPQTKNYKPVSRTASTRTHSVIVRNLLIVHAVQAVPSSLDKEGKHDRIDGQTPNFQHPPSSLLGVRGLPAQACKYSLLTF